MQSIKINEKTFKKSLAEVDKILEKLVSEEYDKIPKEIIDNIKKNKDSKYVWEYDETKQLEEQDLSEYTLSILANINNEYLLESNRANLMFQYYELNEQRAIAIETIKNGEDTFTNDENDELNNLENLDETYEEIVEDTDNYTEDFETESTMNVEEVSENVENEDTVHVNTGVKVGEMTELGLILAEPAENIFDVIVNKISKILKTILGLEDWFIDE